MLAYSEVAIFWFESHFQACCCFIISHLTHVGVTYLNNNSYFLCSTMILRWVYESKRHYLKKLTFIKDVQICNHFKVKRNLDLRMLSLMFQMWGLINFMVVEIFQFFIVFFCRFRNRWSWLFTKWNNFNYREKIQSIPNFIFRKKCYLGLRMSLVLSNIMKTKIGTVGRVCTNEKSKKSWSKSSPSTTFV